MSLSEYDYFNVLTTESPAMKLRETFPALTSSELIEAVSQWSQRNFGAQRSKVTGEGLYSTAPLLGLVEEFGEFAEAKTREDAKDAAGDMLIYLCDFSGRDGVTDFDATRHVAADIDDKPKSLWVPQIVHLLSIKIGKLAHHHLKRHQGIRGYDVTDHYVKLRDEAIGEIWGLIDAYCECLYSESALKIANEVFYKVVSKRNWTTKPPEKETPAHGDIVINSLESTNNRIRINVLDCINCGNRHMEHTASVIDPDSLIYQRHQKTFPELRTTHCHWFECEGRRIYFDEKEQLAAID